MISWLTGLVTKIIGFCALFFVVKKSGKQEAENEYFKKIAEIDAEQLKIAARARAFPRSIVDRLRDKDL